MGNRKRISPKMLYPMTTIESINPDSLKFMVQEIEAGNTILPIQVIDFKGYYIILEGNYEVLASNIKGIHEVEIEVVDWKKDDFYFSENDIREQLRIVGMNALYDFETIGQFKYIDYPEFYKGGK